MQSTVSLSTRAREVLAALVSGFISTGQAVGSRTLSKRYRLGVSPATVRSTMSELEEKGLVYQPHTSAGRLPTDYGIRVFVNSLMETEDLTGLEREYIGRRYDVLTNDGGLWQRTVRLLSELTEHAAVVLSPRPDAVILRQLRFVPLAEGEVLAVLVGTNGASQSHILKVDVELSGWKLERIHNYLNDLVPGRTLAEARRVVETEAKESRRSMDWFTTVALELGRDALAVPDLDQEIVVHGQAKLVQSPGFDDVERLRQLMELLDDQDRLVALLDATMKVVGPWVLIGNEHPFTETASCSMIAASYKRGPRARGTLGVIGPRSMDYGRVLSLVGYTADLLSADLDLTH